MKGALHYYQGDGTGKAICGHSVLGGGDYYVYVWWDMDDYIYATGNFYQPCLLCRDDPRVPLMQLAATELE